MPAPKVKRSNLIPVTKKDQEETDVEDELAEHLDINETLQMVRHSIKGRPNPENNNE